MIECNNHGLTKHSFVNDKRTGRKGYYQYYETCLLDFD